MALEFCFAFSDKETATAAAETYGGTLLSDVKDRDVPNPFAALLCTMNPDSIPLLTAAEVGAYLVDRRVIKHRAALNAVGSQPGAVGVFALVAKSELGHQAADRHWRDRHAPLALSIHLAMSNYAQLSVLHRFKGPVWDGFALCGFESVEDLQTRFFATKAGEQLIAEDVRKFADTKRSPRRIVACETRYLVA